MQRALRTSGIWPWLALRRWLVFGLFAAYAQVIGAQVAIPPLRSPVTDLTGTLDAGQIQQLDRELRAFEARKGGQIAVLIVPTAQPETIEQYSMRVAESWKLGRKGIDDGVLLLVAKDDRAVRIEVGYGLEGSVPDAIANRIIDETLVPQFRQGRFFEGIQAGLGKLIQVIEGEPLPPPSRQLQSKNLDFDILHTVFILFIFTMVLGGMLRALLGRIAGAAATGLLIGLLAWMFIGAFVLAGAAAAIAFVISLLGGFNAGPWSSGGGGLRGGHFGGGGWRGGSGGWSGGGGGFGGGGASGRW